MGTADDTKKWNTNTGIAFVAAIVAGIAVGLLTDIFNAVYTILIVFGCYFAVSMYLRDDTNECGGPSAADGAIIGGVLLAGIGVCGLLYYYTENVIATSVAVIAVMLMAAAIMIVRNKRYL